MDVGIMTINAGIYIFGQILKYMIILYHLH